MTGDAERLARVGLARAVGPDNLRVEAEAREYGVVAVWARIRDRYPDVVPERDLEESGGAWRVICPGEEEWPPGLTDLTVFAGGDGRDAGEPFCLWVRGQGSVAEVCRRSVAVVGARAASDYGNHVSGEIAAGLVDRGWTVVSGAAFGIDAAAHRGALAGSGVTVAVVAGGIDTPYPRAHENLLARIGATGLVVSEAPPGSASLRRRFLSRNRLIAAISRGTVLVEAGLRSGALNTARHARRLGRPLMAVPGPVTSPMSSGCHHLLRTHREDTVVVTSAADVIEEVGSVGDLSERPQIPYGPRDGLPEMVLRVLDAVPARGGAGPAVIAQRARERPEVVLAVLGPLVSQGLVERRADGYRLTALGRAPSAGPVGRPP